MKELSTVEKFSVFSNRPIGKVWRKHQKYWLYLLDTSVTGYEDKMLGESKEETDWNTDNFYSDLNDKGIEIQKIITKGTLPKFFGGKIRDFSYLLKLLETLKSAEYKYHVQQPFSYDQIDDETVVVKIASIPENMVLNT